MTLCEESLIPGRAGLFNFSFKLPDFDFMGLFPIGASTPFFPSINFPEMEGEFRFSLLIQQFHGWIMAKILSIINDLGVVPINFNIPVLSIDIDIFKFFGGDTDYIAMLKKMIMDALDKFYALIPDPFKFWGGEFSASWPDFQFQNIWSYIMRMLNNGLFTLLYDTIMSLIGIIEDMFKVGGPSFPTITIPDIGSIIQSIMNGAGTLWDKIKALLDINIFGFKFGDIMGGDINANFEIPERLLQRIIEALMNFAIEFPKKLLLEAINAIMGFLSMLPGLDAITEFLTLTFCTFLKTIVGFDPNQVATEKGIETNEQESTNQ